MLSQNHYDVALRAYLRHLRIPHVAVNESRRALTPESSLKSLDFIISPPGTTGILVDVKGRRFPSGRQGTGNRWENWITEEDLESLLQWQDIFGKGFRSVLLFVYELVDEKARSLFSETFLFRQRRYSCWGVWADEYQIEMRRRSPSWKTASLSGKSFRELRKPFSFFWEPNPPIGNSDSNSSNLTDSRL